MRSACSCRQKESPGFAPGTFHSLPPDRDESLTATLCPGRGGWQFQTKEKRAVEHGRPAGVTFWPLGLRLACALSLSPGDEKEHEWCQPRNARAVSIVGI